MDIIKIIDYIRKTLKTRQDNVNEAITSDVKTLEDYKYLLGKLHGYNEIQPVSYTHLTLPTILRV